VDELLTHPFLKHPKKISNDPQLLADDMAKNLGFYKEKQLNNTETNPEQICGKKKENFFFAKFIYSIL
jgi:hypothetical protein